MARIFLALDFEKWAKRPGLGNRTRGCYLQLLFFQRKNPSDTLNDLRKKMALPSGQWRQLKGELKAAGLIRGDRLLLDPSIRIWDQEKAS